jgi:putative NIF3 family GTP cyclohydrolase 1 type 2
MQETNKLKTQNIKLKIMRIDIFKKIQTFLMFSILMMITDINLYAQDLTAREVIEKIKKNVTCEWANETVDTFKAGDPDQKVTGIATTFIATLDVLKQAKDLKCNLIITHEPTFYNHLDETSDLQDDPVYKAKMKFIEDNGLIIFRFHDHIHRTNPDGIMEGMLEELDWKDHVISQDPLILKFDKMYVGDLAKELKIDFGKSPIRLIGDPNASFTHVAFAPGAPGYQAHIQLLERDDVDVLVGGEVPEWESITYVRDAVGAGMNKTMILLGHVNSEEAGMKYCAEWLAGFIKNIPIHYIPAGDPFYAPK